MAFKYDTDVLDCLAASGRCLGAYEISGILSEAHKHPVRAVSVYRCLARLVADGLALRVVSQNAFIASSRAGCADRGGLLVISCPVCKAYVAKRTAHGLRIGAAAESAGFRPSTVYLEAIGKCRRCRSRERAEDGRRRPIVRPEPRGLDAVAGRMSQAGRSLDCDILDAVGATRLSDLARAGERSCS